MILYENARACIEIPEVITLDEGRSKNASVSNRNSTFTPAKPIRNAVDVHYVACSLQNLCGYMCHANPHCKDEMMSDDIKLDDEEGLMDNIVHQAILEIDHPNSVLFTDLKVHFSVHCRNSIT